MGVYIKGMEMPKDCPMCPFANYDMFNTFSGCDITSGKRWAVKNDKDYAESSTRPDWCPLIEVPEPHGRLIDADAVFNNLERTGWYDNADRDIAEDLVLDAPTIIGEEEAESCLF